MAATVLSTSCTQKLIHPYRRQAMAAFFRFCRATSDTSAGGAPSGGAPVAAARGGNGAEAPRRRTAAGAACSCSRD